MKWPCAVVGMFLFMFLFPFSLSFAVVYLVHDPWMILFIQNTILRTPCVLTSDTATFVVRNISSSFDDRQAVSTVRGLSSRNY